MVVNSKETRATLGLLEPLAGRKKLTQITANGDALNQIVMVVSCSSFFVHNCYYSHLSVCRHFCVFTLSPYMDYYFVVRAQGIVQDMVNFNYVSSFTGYKDLHWHVKIRLIVLEEYHTSISLVLVHRHHLMCTTKWLYWQAQYMTL